MHPLRYVAVDGMRHAYRESGTGRTLVLISGILSDSRFWEPQLSGLGDAFRVIAWDAPGTGGTDDPDEHTGVGGYASMLRGFLAAIDAVPADLVGLSWGGVLALESYRRFPEMIRSLILADTYAGWKGSLPAKEYEARRAAALRDLKHRPPDDVPDHVPNVMHPAAPASARQRLQDIIDDARPAGYRAMARALIDVDSSDVLGTIEVPTLLIWGEDDARSPLSVAQAMQASIPGARLVLVPGAGHVSSLERPEAFDAAIRDFIATLGPIPS
jgi:pimeloyl-ACP methyl ester carboxylesterase